MIIHGTITKKLDDGSNAECSYVLDTETKEVVQVGGEGQIVAEDIDLIRDVLLRDTSNDPIYDEEPGE